MGESFLSPVLTKELKERFRTFRGSLVVTFYVGSVIAITLAFIYLTTRHYQGFQPGRSKEFFILLSMLQLFLIAFVTPGLSAGAISSERERQTLNILLTTRLSTTSIILSKLISSLAFIILLILATLPIYALVTLYGGIASHQLAGVFGLYFLNMVFFGSVGIFMSTLIKRTGVSTVLSYAVIFAIVVATALGAELMDQYFRSQYIREFGGMNRMEDAMYIPYQTPQLVWIVRSLNPIIVMISIFEQMIHNQLDFAPWVIYTLFYGFISIILILLSIYLLKPIKRLRKLKTEKANIG